MQAEPCSSTAMESWPWHNIMAKSCSGILTVMLQAHDAEPGFCWVQACWNAKIGSRSPRAVQALLFNAQGRSKTGEQ